MLLTESPMQFSGTAFTRGRRSGRTNWGNLSTPQVSRTRRRFIDCVRVAQSNEDWSDRDKKIEVAQLILLNWKYQKGMTIAFDRHHDRLLDFPSLDAFFLGLEE